MEQGPFGWRVLALHGVAPADETAEQRRSPPCYINGIFPLPWVTLCGVFFVPVFDMGKFSFFIVLLSIEVFYHNALGCCGYGGYGFYERNLDGASLRYKQNGLTSPHLDPSFVVMMNGSHAIQQSTNKDAAQFDAAPSFNYIAEHIMSSQNYYGIEVASDIYGFQLEHNTRTGIFVHLVNHGDGKRSSQNIITFGWHGHPTRAKVAPKEYGDSKTHFYVFWTRDGNEKTACLDLNCPGYEPEPNIPTVPGINIDVVSDPGGDKRTIIFKVLKDSVGDWLMHVGFDSEPYLIGRFPNHLFTTLGDKADSIYLGGFVIGPKTIPMGSGFCPKSIKAASFSNIQVIGKNGKKSKVQRDQPSRMTDKNIYGVSPITAEGKFTYGGPFQ
ncbi:hypothetical protein ACP4OV_030010 [Aristida adscensionis]